MAKRKYSTSEVAAWETYCRLGHSFEEAAQKFGVPAGTIRQTASREKWRQRDLSQERRSMASTVAQIVTETWAEKAEAHRQKMFKLASDALDKASLPPPKNWRDAETADKIARRASGLDDDSGQRTLVQIGMLRGPDPASVDA
jgi:transposase